MLSEEQKNKIIKEMEKEFPNDTALQQIHIARKILAKEAELKGMKYIDYIKSISKDLEVTQ